MSHKCDTLFSAFDGLFYNSRLPARFTHGRFTNPLPLLNVGNLDRVSFPEVDEPPAKFSSFELSKIEDIHIRFNVLFCLELVIGNRGRICRAIRMLYL